MGMKELGKWAWIIGLALLVLGGILGAFMDNPISGVIADVAIALAFIGGLLHFGGGDHTGFYIAAAALMWFGGSAGTLFVDVLGNLVSGILGGAALAAGAAAAGSLLMVVYEWVMP